MTWLTVHTPDGVMCWQVVDDADRRDDQVCRARLLTGFPAGDEWIRDAESPWRLRLTEGMPHPRLGAVPRDTAELDAADAAAVLAYRDQREQAASAARREAARAVLSECTSDERAEVIGEVPPRSAASDGGGSPW